VSQIVVARALENLFRAAGGSRAYTHCPKHRIAEALQPEAQIEISTCTAVVGCWFRLQRGLEPIEIRLLRAVRKAMPKNS
jgi:hypothetical protein